MHWLYSTTYDVRLLTVNWYWDFKSGCHELLCLDGYLCNNHWNESRKPLLSGISSVLTFFLFSFLLFFLILNFVSSVCNNKNWEQGNDLRRTQLLRKCRGLYPQSRWSISTVSLEPYFFLCLFLPKDVFYWLYHITVYWVIWKEQMVNFSNIQCNSILRESGYAFQLCHEILFC